MVKRFVRSRSFYVLLVSVTVCLVFVSYEAWDYWTEDAQRHIVKDNLPSAPANRNIRAIDEIAALLHGRSSFRFIVFGDVHQNTQRLRRIVEDSRRFSPDFIVHTGDFANNGHYHEYRRILSTLDALDIPFVTCAGNHDLENYGYRCFSRMFGPLNFYFDVSGYRFIFLNNVERRVNTDMVPLPESDYQYRLSRGVDAPLLASVDQLMGEASHVFVVMHIPPPLPPFDFYCFHRNGEAFLDLMSSHADRVAAVFFGHIHGYGTTRHRGVAYIEAGGAGDFRALNENRTGLTNRHNYVLVRVDGDSVSQTVHFLD